MGSIMDWLKVALPIIATGLISWYATTVTLSVEIANLKDNFVKMEERLYSRAQAQSDLAFRDFQITDLRDRVEDLEDQVDEMEKHLPLDR